jgi:hypothetical protein
MVTPPVGRCSTLVCGGKILMLLLLNKETGKSFCVFLNFYRYNTYIETKEKYFWFFISFIKA